MAEYTVGDLVDVTGVLLDTDNKRDQGFPYLIRLADTDDEFWVRNIKPYNNELANAGVENTMSQPSKITSIVSRAKDATYTAASLQAGKALNVAVIKAAKAKAPMMVRGYMEHPAAPALVALAVVALSEHLPSGSARAKVSKAADLMLAAALFDGADKFFDVEGLIDSALSSLPQNVLSALEP